MVRRRVLAGLGLAAVGALVTVTAAAIAPPATETGRPALGGIPAPLAPAFRPGPARPLRSTRYLSHWAPVLRTDVARAAPDRASPIVAHVSPRTPEGTRNVVSVMAIDADRAGNGWVRIRLAALPNGLTGWLRRSSLGGYGTVVTRLEVNLDALRAVLYRDGRPVLRAPVAVGTASWPTPRGEFYVRNKLTRYRSPEYGPVAFGTSARSPTATDWPAGGFVGIHGTDRPELVPGRVSHGCIRMRNSDIVELAAQMPVGTPLTIH